jgi:hypothetical protein
MRKKFTQEIFESHFIPITESGCWIWIGGLRENGYGYHAFNGKKEQAHRISWEIYKGPIPQGKFVLHKCDVRPCVNPDHLFIGTQKDNIQDCIQKGRIANGERIGNSLLTEDQVSKIKNDHRSYRVIAKDFHVEATAIFRIKHGITWKHIHS